MSMAPHTQAMVEETDPVAAGADANVEVGVVTEQGGGVVTSVTYTPVALITGAATNNRTFNLLNRRTGLVVATLNMGNGVNAALATPTNIPITGPANVNAGDVLEFQSVHVGTGIADPGGLVSVTVTRTTAAQ